MTTLIRIQSYPMNGLDEREIWLKYVSQRPIEQAILGLKFALSLASQVQRTDPQGGVVAVRAANTMLQYDPQALELLPIPVGRSVLSVYAPDKLVLFRMEDRGRQCGYLLLQATKGFLRKRRQQIKNMAVLEQCVMVFEAAPDTEPKVEG